VSSDTITLADREDLAIDDSKFDLVKAALQALEINPSEAKFSLSVRTDVPEQAGLAGSTAMLACVTGCLLAYLGIELDRHELAEMIHATEADIMHMTCGYQDHYMTVFGGLNSMDFNGKEWMGRRGEEPFATIEPLGDTFDGLPMILAHTGVKRNSGSVHKSLRQRWTEGDKTVMDAYSRITELGRLGKKALLAQDWDALGALMNENHAIQRDLGGSSECNEKLIEAALADGAWGAKLAGAGHGGTIIALCSDPERVAGILQDAGAERILRLKPADGLIIEREW
jgi:galactokinase/mevalonate kinase-like predicted kinase